MFQAGKLCLLLFSVKTRLRLSEIIRLGLTVALVCAFLEQDLIVLERWRRILGQAAHVAIPGPAGGGRFIILWVRVLHEGSPSWCWAKRSGKRRRDPKQFPKEVM